MAARQVVRRSGFLAQPTGRLTEPLICSEAWCQFRRGPPRVESGLIVLVQRHAGPDVESGSAFLVKRLRLALSRDEDGSRERAVTLESDNPAFDPIVIAQDDFAMVAEFVEVLRPFPEEP